MAVMIPHKPYRFWYWCCPFGHWGRSGDVHSAPAPQRYRSQKEAENDNQYVLDEWENVYVHPDLIITTGDPATTGEHIPEGGAAGVRSVPVLEWLLMWH